MLAVASLRPKLTMPLGGVAVCAAAIAFAGGTLAMAHLRPAAPCTATPSHGEFLDGRGARLDSRQVGALRCLMEQPLVPRAAVVPGLGRATPNVSVTARGMMYNVTWRTADGRTASLMNDRHIGSNLDHAFSNIPVDLGHGVRGWWTNWSDDPADRTNPLTHEFAWLDPRTHRWYKINGLSLPNAIAFYRTLTPVQLKDAM